MARSIVPGKRRVTQTGTGMSKYFLWVYGATAVILLAEIIAGRHKGIYTKGELSLLALSMGLGRFLLAPLASVGVASVWGALLPQGKGVLSDTPFWIAFPAVLLVAEFFFYWVHRWAHEGQKRRSALYMIHRTHHTARYMNVAVWMRLNLWWYFIIPNAWSLGLAIYLGWTDAAIAAAVLNAGWNLITHAGFRWDDAIRRHKLAGPVFRALEHVIVSPGIHHTHHGYGTDGASFRNFGVMLSVWDWAFGTLHIPEGRPWRYGVPGHDAHWTEELLWPVVRSPAKSAQPVGAPR